MLDSVLIRDKAINPHLSTGLVKLSVFQMVRHYSSDSTYLKKPARFRQQPSLCPKLTLAQTVTKVQEHFSASSLVPCSSRYRSQCQQGSRKNRDMTLGSDRLFWEALHS